MDRSRNFVDPQLGLVLSVLVVLGIVLAIVGWYRWAA
jgi:hypothetical protein